MSLFKSKILHAIDQIKQKKKRPDVNRIYEYLGKIELIETILGNLFETDIIVNRKTPKCLDSFLIVEDVEAPVHALDTVTKQANMASNAETQTEFSKRDWFSLITRETQTEGKITIDVMMQTDRVYTSNRNGDTAQECMNIDMIKLRIVYQLSCVNLDCQGGDF